MLPPRVCTRLALVFLMGCSRQPKKTAASEASLPEAGNGAIVAAPRATTKPLRRVCTARPVTPDPGPTKASAEILGGSLKAPNDKCVTHAECKESRYGRCVPMPASRDSSHGMSWDTPAHNTCVYDECLSDEECRTRAEHSPAAELVCSCNPSGSNVCGNANCRENADCPTGFPCGAGAYCHALGDECRRDADCPGAKNQCRYDHTAKKYVCKPPDIAFPG
jgi:hypothetical protein